MINIHFEPPDDEKWSKWCTKCSEERGKLVDSYNGDKEPRKINEALYKKQKKFFFDENGPFHGKCAYCEVSIKTGQHGHLDHYRPKKKVTVSRKVVKVTDDKGNELEHRGYFWLAYDYKNLIPVCVACNCVSNKHNSEKKYIGKGNEFPVKGFRAVHEGEEDLEEPLLLNPTMEGIKIEDHLGLDSTGLFKFISDKGEVTCELLGLNSREGVVSCREKAYKEGYDAILLYLAAKQRNDIHDINRHLNTILGYIKGKLPYSAAGRLGLRDSPIEKEYGILKTIFEEKD